MGIGREISHRGHREEGIASHPASPPQEPKDTKKEAEESDASSSEGRNQVAVGLGELR